MVLILICTEKIKNNDDIDARFRIYLHYVGRNLIKPFKLWVYACGQENGITYNTLFDGEVDKNGEIQITYVGVSKPDVKQESTMIIPGIRFFKKGGKNVYIRFYKKSPQEEIGKPLLYKFENGILSLELPMGVFVSNCSPDVFYSGSGKFQEMPIEFMDNGQIKFNNVTYSKKK